MRGRDATGGGSSSQGWCQPQCDVHKFQVVVDFLLGIPEAKPTVAHVGDDGQAMRELKACHPSTHRSQLVLADKHLLGEFPVRAVGLGVEAAAECYYDVIVAQFLNGIQFRGWGWLEAGAWLGFQSDAYGS